MAWGDEKDEKWRTRAASIFDKPKREADWGTPSLFDKPKRFAAPEKVIQVGEVPQEKEPWRRDPAWRERAGKEPWRTENAPWRKEPEWRKGEPEWRKRQGNEEWRKEPEWQPRLGHEPWRTENAPWRQDPPWRAEPWWRKPPPAGRETGDVRKLLLGDPELAVQFVGPARTLLGMLKNDMSFNQLDQGLRRAVIPINQRIEIGPELYQEGGVDISRKLFQVIGTVAMVATSSFGQDAIVIDARTIKTTEITPMPKPPKEPYLPYVRILLTPALTDTGFQGQWSMTIVDKAAFYENDGSNARLVYVTQSETSNDYTYDSITNGYGGSGAFQNTETFTLNDPPASVQENLNIARNESDDDLDGQFHYDALYVFDPADEAHPGKIGELDEWIVVKLQHAAGADESIPDFHVIIDLGAPPYTQRFHIALAGARLDNAFPGPPPPTGYFFGSTGAIFVNVRQGVIFHTDSYVIPPGGNSSFGFNVTPADPGDYEGTLIFHPNSPMLVAP